MPSNLHHHSPTFDTVSWLAKKYRVSRPHARVIAELNGFDGKPEMSSSSSPAGAARQPVQVRT
jgi:hypothetical protein